MLHSGIDLQYRCCTFVHIQAITFSVIMEWNILRSIMDFSAPTIFHYTSSDIVPAGYRYAF